MLQWSCIQNKDFTNALRQAKALDKRLNGVVQGNVHWQYLHERKRI
ncbi:MAG: hypothetical protein U0T81_18215 [Saprospiraceae bacterium]